MRKKTGLVKLAAASAILALSACMISGTVLAEEETDEAVFEELAENVPGETELAEEETEQVVTAPEYDINECVELGEYLGLSLDPIEVTVTDVDVEMTIENTVKSRNLYDELTEGTVENGKREMNWRKATPPKSIMKERSTVLLLTAARRRVMTSRSVPERLSRDLKKGLSVRRSARRSTWM